MNIIGQVTINNFIDVDKKDIIGVFDDNGVCHGVANIGNGDDEFLVYINVFNDTSENKDLHFRLWHSATGNMLLLHTDEPIQFKASGLVGSVTNPIILKGGTEFVQTINLQQGWNWVSFNVETNLDDLKAALVEAAPGTSITIKGQTQNATYNPNNGRWTGQLRTLDLSKMYIIKVADACEITLEGMPVDPSMHPVTIAPGVNWIAYPFNTNMTVTNAFAGFAVTNDKVQSQLQNANYNGTRWTGQLRNLEPGQGYIYNSASAETRTFTFPLGN
jgi:hypothetical protein